MNERSSSRFLAEKERFKENNANNNNQKFSGNETKFHVCLALYFFID